ncbi:hypothetical protein K7X08_020253 [Anisodus acutangulus]|uniref:Uncharacterized protein n=1 Tax=Anisodus acutangulus TaxID=402998 RepID=A0A9Q1RE57_9SOLA|nr:hypothetical protein K7X08_020253 [Anisodus acutangulus]
MEEIKKGAWSPEEDQKLKAYIMRYGIWNWNLMPKFAGLSRTGKSCRLRWMNYLRPDVKRGPFSMEEVETVIKMYQELGNRWAAIAARFPGRTDNEVKNFFHTHLKKHLKLKNIDAPVKSKARLKRVLEKNKKTNTGKADQEKPILFLDIGPAGTSYNSSLISPDISSSCSSIITFDGNQKMNIDDMENTVILESNPASTHHETDPCFISESFSIDSLDQFDTSSFWLHLLNDVNRLIL